MKEKYHDLPQETTRHEENSQKDDKIRDRMTMEWNELSAKWIKCELPMKSRMKSAQLTNQWSSHTQRTQNIDEKT